MKESIFVTLQKCTVFEGFTPEEIREALSMVSYRMVGACCQGNLCAGRNALQICRHHCRGGDDSPHVGIVGQAGPDRAAGRIDVDSPAYIFAHNNEMPVSVETSKKTTLLRMRPSELKLLIRY